MESPPRGNPRNRIKHRVNTKVYPKNESIRETHRYTTKNMPHLEGFANPTRVCLQKGRPVHGLDRIVVLMLLRMYQYTKSNAHVVVFFVSTCLFAQQLCIIIVHGGPASYAARRSIETRGVFDFSCSGANAIASSFRL